MPTQHTQKHYNADRDSIYHNSTKVNIPNRPRDMRDDIVRDTGKKYNQKRKDKNGLGIKYCK